MALFTTYTLSEIIEFIIILACAIKGAISFYDWMKQRLDQVFVKNYNNKNDKEKVQQLEENQEQFAKTLAEIIDKINLLMESDKDDIKAWITKEHHYFCYEQGWIDDYSLDCLTKRYSHYKDEGGNSFIDQFMNELKVLPKHPKEGE